MPEKQENRYEQYRSRVSESPVLAEGLGKERREKGIVEEISTCVLAPALDSFVLWVLQNAEKRGIRRLYFLARDGYFMYRCASAFCRRLRLPIECRYLYCSRYSLRIPSYHLDMEAAMEYICRGGIRVTRRKIIERSGIGRKEQEEVLRLLDYTRNAEEEVPYAVLGKIRKELEQCKAFRAYIEQNSKKALPVLKDYLIQEGFLEDTAFALVDSGWVGSMQKTLDGLLRELGCRREAEGYYWGLYELPEGVRSETCHGYYFEPARGLKEKVYFSNCLFEAVFSAPHGMTVGYRKQGEKTVPVLGAFSEERKRFMEQTERYLMRYTERLAEALERRQRENGNVLRDIDCAADLKTVKKLISAFMGHPTREEAEVYGALRFSDDIMDDAERQVAEPLNEKELRENHVLNKALHMTGIRHGTVKESAWYEGSAALLGRHADSHRRQYALYKYLLYIRQTYWKKRK